ncbi:MAG TPA: hypothetical protein VK994_06290 [Bacteroidales bacterium]|nr:hypothetical protein [Bacteroidales bacterium]
MMNVTRKKVVSLALTIILGLAAVSGCKKGDDPNSDIPYAHINVTINPNSTMYQELNIVGGWMYYPWVDAPSRGLIIYRLTQEDFKAYERTPPVNSNACCDIETGSCTALVVDDYYPFVHDTCSDLNFQIIDGSPITPATIPLKSYHTLYDGTNLYITN